MAESSNYSMKEDKVVLISIIVKGMYILVCEVFVGRFGICVNKIIQHVKV